MHQTINFHLLFSQLQARYPLSNLITELIQYQDGQFVVRALVVMGNTTLATGLAAASTVELAEDQARLRALALLGVDKLAEPVSLPPPVPTPVPPSPSANGFAPLPPLPTPTWLEHEFSEAEASPPSSEFAHAELSVEFASTEEDHADEQFDSIADNGSTNEPDLDGMDGMETDVPPPLPLSSINQEPDDLSYLIAQTDIEMDRIGWSKQKGRDHLKRTYNKSTRQRLDVNELMDFLNYLRALPSPNGV